MGNGGLNGSVLGGHVADAPLYEPSLLGASCLSVEPAEPLLLLAELPGEGVQVADLGSLQTILELLLP